MKHIKLFITALILGLGTSSCDKYLDVNADPSNPQIAEGYVLLPPILANMALGIQFDTRYIGKYTQNFASSAANDVWDQHGYQSGSDNSGQLWRNHYWVIGKNIDLIIDDATAKQKWDYSGVSKAIRAWSWQMCTDYHGEMILKQAWEPNRYVFDYDSQEDIYKEVIRLSNDALTDLAKTDGGVSITSLGRGDIVFKGDRSKWTKFVYAILARNAHHLSNKASYDPAKVIEYVDKSLASNADNFNVPFNGTGSGDASFYGPLRNNLGAFRQTAFMVSLLDGTTFNGVTDPRISIICTASPDGVFRGVVPTFGDPNNVNNNVKRIPTLWGELPNLFVSTTTPGKYVYRDKAALPIVTYSELQFIKAEAAFKKGDKTMALDAYKKAIEAHMDYSGVAAADKAKYMTSKAVAQTTGDLTLSDIMLQKYISLAMHNSIETWVDMRRHHYDANIYKGFTLPTPTQLFGDNGGKPAYRVRPRYNSEYVWNLKSLAVYGGDKADYHTVEQWFTKP
jgi:tetratricopeptide (TPR) repeat protein